MITADDTYYETLKLAADLVRLAEAEIAAGRPNPTCGPSAYKLAKALLDVEERRQLALGELGEAVMKNSPYSYIERASDILAGRIEV